MNKIDFLGKYPQSDIGTSKLFIDVFSDELVYCAELDIWYIWNNSFWEPDLILRRNELIKQLAKYTVEYIFQNAEQDQQANLIKYYSKLTDKNFRDKILKDSMSIAPVRAKAFDRHKFLFNCINGTYDFATGKFRPHDRKDMITCCSRVVYDKNAQATRFKEYLNEVMENDSAKIDYLLKIAAYALTGDTRHECFFVLYGDKTRNGKSTFTGTLQYLVGNYGNTLKPAAVTRKQINSGASNASPEMAKLKNSRLVIIPEIEEGMMLDVALIKSMTGNNIQSARPLYKAEFEFEPQYKLIFDTNILPKMTDDTIFKSDRIHLLEFSRHFQEAERDINLKDKLRKEISGIFNILTAAYEKLAIEGFLMPDCSRKIISAYHLNSNNILAFMKECLNEIPGAYEKASDIYERYKTWCEESGLQPLAKKNFRERFCRLGAVYIEKSYQKCYSSDTFESNYFYRNFSWIKPKTEVKQQKIAENEEELGY